MRAEAVDAAPRGAERGAGTLAALIGVGLIVVLVVAMLSMLGTLSYDLWSGILTGVVLTAVSVPLLLVITRNEPDPRIRLLIPIALVLKLVAAWVRYHVAFDVYGGTADASMYITWGNDLAEQFRAGTFDVDVGRDRFIGTGFMRYVTGLAFAVSGTTGFGGFVVFSWLSFWGLFGFYRAFRLAVPDGHHLRYALLVFLLPSVLFWPSSIGKEAWMIAVLGLTAYGAARLLTRTPGGYLPTALGLAGIVAMRPHIGMLVCVGLAGGYLYRRRANGRPPLFGPVPSAVGIVMLVVVSVFVLQQAEGFFGVDEAIGVAEGAEEALEQTEAQTDMGGSAFGGDVADSPVDLPRAIATVLFRPFPWEAENPQMLAASLEGVLLMALFVVSWRRVWSGLKLAVRNPYVRFALVYGLAFIVAYTAVGNFGILARQRVQLFPLVLMFLAMPVVVPRRRSKWERFDPEPENGTPAWMDTDRASVNGGGRVGADGRPLGPAHSWQPPEQEPRWR